MTDAVDPHRAPTALPWRGLVEGFYGTPWSGAERRAYFAFAAPLGLDRYVYAPKSDPYHRERWREPYPEAQLAELAALAADAKAVGIRFGYAISPGLSMRFADPADAAALAAKARQLFDAGIRHFCVLFDDVPPTLTDAADLARFGDDDAAVGRAHGAAASEFAGFLRTELGITEPLLVCPTDYAGIAPSPYREGLAETLPTDALLFWTGSDIVVGEVTRAAVDAAAASYRRDLVLWDNFPVNDFDRSRLFLGPLTGRAGDVVGSRLVGIAVNPMVEAAPSRFAIAACAEWAAYPARYDPDAAAARARRLVAGPAAEGLAPLLDACSSWPPSAAPDPALDALIERARRGDVAALAEVRGRMEALAATSSAGAPADLRSALLPWVRAAQAVGAAGVLACRLLANDGRSDAAATVSALRAAWTAAEAHYPNVLRSSVELLVAAALERAGAPRLPVTAPQGGRVLLLTGANPSPGDRELAEFLHADGHAVTIRSESAASDIAPDFDLVIIARAASERAALELADIAIPVIAWGHLVALRLASASEMPLALDTIELSDGDHPIAAGLAGAVRAYRGPSRLTWGVPASGGRVIASTPQDRHPVLVLYDAGMPLVDGRPAPAARLTFFLGSDGFAPWLVTDATRQIVRAAVTHLLGRAA
ncbi:hypothetical protein GCM10022287_27760 [Gryllotalpicola koreensis]|uniref:GH84 domain-containing protein n=1 Tax=Gryllotalpicola koreensis TaxID=993086 RepID=A0ABP8A559_9MICO